MTLLRIRNLGSTVRAWRKDSVPQRKVPRRCFSHIQTEWSMVQRHCGHKEFPNQDQNSLANFKKIEGSLHEDWLIFIRPSFLRYALELRMTNSFGRVSRSLRTYPVTVYSSPIQTEARESCENGDIQGLKISFTDGRLSPLTVDENGVTLFHVRISYASYYDVKWELSLHRPPQGTTDRMCALGCFN